jgi:membrane protease YdiL (CAAX protease family)
MKLFLLSNSILVPIAVHAIIDLNSGVLMPMLAQRASKRR